MTPSTNKDITGKVGYQRRLCCLSQWGINEQLLTIFAKIAPSQMFHWVENKVLPSGYGFEILSSLLFPAYKLNWENTQSEYMSDNVFKKAKGRGGTVNRTSLYTEAAVQRVLYKRCWEKFFKIHKKTFVPESLFW